MAGKAKPRRRVVVSITPEVLQGMFTTGWRADLECIKGLPPTAICISCSYSAWHNAFEMCFEDESFDIVDDAMTPPAVNVQMTQHYHASE
jgi:hypothetical protein